jgi:hypothetical protein
MGGKTKGGEWEGGRGREGNEREEYVRERITDRGRLRYDPLEWMPLPRTEKAYSRIMTKTTSVC